MKRNKKELLVAVFGITFCVLLLANSVYVSIINKPTYSATITVFDVTHTENKKGQWTNVYTNGTGQFYFRGWYEFEIDSVYNITYQVNFKRWRDLTLIEYIKIKECYTCPE